jgi:RNA polymerase sigma factor (sigma-70 family)
MAVPSPYVDVSDLVLRWQKTRDQALMVEIINHLELLVISFVNKYKKFHPNIEDDIRSEVHIGILLAAEKYEKELNTKFTTYAYYIIRQQVQLYIKTLGCEDEIQLDNEHESSYITDEDGFAVALDVKRAIASLPEDFAKVAELRVFYGLSFEDIGNLLDLSRQRVHQKFQVFVAEYERLTKE